METLNPMAEKRGSLREVPEKAENSYYAGDDLNTGNISEIRIKGKR